MQMIPVKGSVFENMPLTSNKEIMDLRKKCGEHIEQMYHCKQCRADAIGLLGDDQSQKFNKPSNVKEVTEEKPLKFAIASKSGIGVDMHFGHASEFYIYEYKNGEPRYLEKEMLKNIVMVKKFVRKRKISLLSFQKLFQTAMEYFVLELVMNQKENLKV